MKPPSPRAAYQEFQDLLTTLEPHELQSALGEALHRATGMDYSEYMPIPDSLLARQFIYAWYRYVLWRYHVYGELLHAFTWKETLLMLSEEPTMTHAIDAIRRSIRNHWKGIFPSADKKDTYISLHTTRADRGKAAEGGVIDTVRRRKPVDAPDKSANHLTLIDNQQPQP